MFGRTFCGNFVGEKCFGGKILVENFGGNAIFDILEPCFAYTVSWKHFVFVFVYVYMYLSLFSLHLGHCHHQMISFKKLYGFYGLEYHTVEINGDVTMGNDQPTE